MNTETTANAEAPHAMRMTRAAAASKGLLPPREQAAHDRQKAATEHNNPIREQMKLTSLKAQICAECLPQLVIKLCQTTSDDELIQRRLGIARYQIYDLLEALFVHESKALAELESKLLPDHHPGEHSSFVDLIRSKGPRQCR